MQKCEHCGAEKKLSKKGNWYCSQMCWKNKPGYQEYNSTSQPQNVRYQLDGDFVPRAEFEEKIGLIRKAFADLQARVEKCERNIWSDTPLPMDDINVNDIPFGNE